MADDDSLPSEESDVIPFPKPEDFLDSSLKGNFGLIPYSTLHVIRGIPATKRKFLTFISGLDVHCWITAVEQVYGSQGLLFKYVYTIEVQHHTFNWTIRRKYRDFYHLHQSVMWQRAKSKLPSGSHAGNNVIFDELFFKDEKLDLKLPRRPEALIHREGKCEKRRAKLEAYLNNLLKSNIYQRLPAAVKFFEISFLSFVDGLGSKHKEGVAFKKAGGYRASQLPSCISLPFALLPVKKWQHHWFVLKESSIIYFNHEHVIRDVILLDSTSTCVRPCDHSRHFTVCTPSRDLTLRFRKQSKTDEWYLAISDLLTRINMDSSATPYDSFSIPRPESFAQWFVDGDQYFSTVADALEDAKEEIFIADWWLSPEMQLKRPIVEGDYWRLDKILERKANQGVFIFVLLYKELSLATLLDSLYTKSRLRSVHPNVHVLRHPDHARTGVFLWSHHEKMVIVDQSIAFVGGLDLCYGRWDDPNHRLTDLGSMMDAGRCCVEHAAVVEQQSCQIPDIVIELCDDTSHAERSEASNYDDLNTLLSVNIMHHKTTNNDGLHMRLRNTARVAEQNDIKSRPARMHSYHGGSSLSGFSKRVSVCPSNLHSIVRHMMSPTLNSTDVCDSEVHTSWHGAYHRALGRSMSVPCKNEVKNYHEQLDALRQKTSSITEELEETDVQVHDAIEPIQVTSAGTPQSCEAQPLDMPDGRTQPARRSVAFGKVDELIGPNTSYDINTDHEEVIPASGSRLTLGNIWHNFGRKHSQRNRSVSQKSLSDDGANTSTAGSDSAASGHEEMQKTRAESHWHELRRKLSLRQNASTESADTSGPRTSSGAKGWARLATIMKATAAFTPRTSRTSLSSEDGDRLRRHIPRFLRQPSVTDRYEDVYKAPDDELMNIRQGSLFGHSAASDVTGSSMSTIWVGKDYANFVIQGWVDLDKPFSDLIDREAHPRTPWHDVCCVVLGHGARDLGRHFIQRWNFTKREKAKRNKKYPLLVPKSTCSVSIPDAWKQYCFPCTVQSLRSASTWSAGIKHTECSIQHAYIDLVRNAQHFIYIENQYFISISQDHLVLNNIAGALFDRICKAHELNETFRVYIVMPLVPIPEAVIHLVYKSICRGKNSLIQRLLAHGADPERFISFCGLRTWAELKGELVTEMVYVHSKCMIIDDRVTIMGSANINDRSMLGKRDSEVAVVIRDSLAGEHAVPTLMNGSPYNAGKFSFSLRVALMKEHLGILDGTNGANPDLRDPVSNHFFSDVWRMTAQSNTECYERVFRCTPTDTVHDIWQLKTRMAQPVPAKLSPQTCKHDLQNIRGYLVTFPLQFMKDVNLEPYYKVAKEYLVPNHIWT